jgi:hypothetical protein
LRSNGQGRLTVSDPHKFSGFIYDGQFKDDNIHGKGVLTYPDNAPRPPEHTGIKKVEGVWKENKLIKTTKLVPFQASEPNATMKPLSEKLSLTKAKEECAELGFSRGTQKYGECVLHLHK